MASYLLINYMPTLLVENGILASSGNSLLFLSLVDGYNLKLVPIACCNHSQLTFIQLQPATFILSTKETKIKNFYSKYSLKFCSTRSQKFHPTFKVVSNTQQANEFAIESFLKEGANLQFHPSLRNFPDNSNTRGVLFVCLFLNGGIRSG